MFRYTFLLALLSTAVNAIDKEVFKNCSRVDFCSRLRSSRPNENSAYYADIKSWHDKNNTIVIPLGNNKNESLNLMIYLLKDNTIRVKIGESGTQRFELRTGWVLSDEPQQISYWTVNEANKSIAFHAVDPYTYTVIVADGPPFKVEFYHNNQLEVVLDGDRIILEDTEDSNAFTFGVDFVGEKLYGLFDHAWKLALEETVKAGGDPFRFRNSDSWGYEANSPMALYGSVPAIYGHSASHTAGIFLHNAAEQWIDIFNDSGKPSAYFMVGGGSLDLFILLGPTTKEVVRQFTKLTGTAPLPQLWTLGYHQCRFSYSSDEEVKTVASLMVANSFPMDAIWLDGDHTDDYEWFHWNHTTYTNPVEMQKNISALNKVCVSISDPHIKVDDDYEVYAGGKGKYFVQWENGSDYQGDCWPGRSSWIDFFSERASDYYGKWYSYDNFNGSTPTLAGIWNDMNEPAIFNDSIEKTLPFEVVHRLDDDAKTVVKHRDVHNIYGLLHTQATYNGLLERDNGKKRPFILSRSHFAGSQRVAAVWTGDNTASWEHFANSWSQCMTGNIFGMVFCGADIGGFIGNPDDELLQRWYQGAVWTPFFRGHSSRESDRREPYLFSETTQDVIRSAIGLRYKHVPYLYKVFYEHTRTGDPIIAPLFYHYPGIHELDTQMIIGGDIMAVAVVKSNVSSVEVFFPGAKTDVWYRIDDETWTPHLGGTSEDIKVDIKTSPVFYKGGSIITRKDEVKLSTFDSANDTYTLFVNLNGSNQASGRLYEDDFTSFEYTTRKNYLYLNITYHPATQGVHFEVLDGSGADFNPKFHQVVVHSVRSSGESGSLEVVKTVHSKTKEGQPLRTVNIADKLATKDKRVFIPL